MLDPQNSRAETDQAPDDGDAEPDSVTPITVPVEAQYFARMPVPRDAKYYNMNHSYRGMAYIYNHKYFDIPTLNTRRGTNVDCSDLSNILNQLGFQVSERHNYKSVDVIKDIEDIVKMDHSDYDCLLIAVLTHGESENLYAKDATYKPEQLWYHFTSDKCPTLAGKPKLFFIQACQGDRVGGPTEIDAKPTVYEYKMPVHADFLIVFSTIPGYYSWKKTIRGSWFIQALCEELRNSATTRDILTLLTFVCQRVAWKFESNTPDQMNYRKQVPCITSMLTRTLTFGAHDIERINYSNDDDQPGPSILSKAKKTFKN